MSFKVTPSVVKRSSGEVHEVQGTIDDARSYVTNNVRSCASGPLIDFFKDQLNGIASGLETVYGTHGAAQRPLTGGVSSLRHAASDYDTVDASARSSLDDKVTSITPVQRQYDWYTSLDPQGEERGVNTCAYGMILAPPTSTHKTYEDWKSIEDQIGKINELWSPSQSTVLKAFGLSDPIEKFKKKMEGKWSEIGTSIGALEQVATYWNLVTKDLGATAIALDDAWDGNASELAIKFFHDYADTADAHAKELQTLATRLNGMTIGIRMSCETVLGLVSELIDVLPSSLSPEDLLSAATKIPVKMVQLVALIFDALFATCSLVVANIAWFTSMTDKSDLSFGTVKSPGVIPVAG